MRSRARLSCQVPREVRIEGIDRDFPEDLITSARAGKGSMLLTVETMNGCTPGSGQHIRTKALFFKENMEGQPPPFARRGHGPRDHRETGLAKRKPRITVVIRDLP